MDYALQVEPAPYDPAKAKQLLAEAGYPNGLDAGELVPIPPFTDVSEAVVNYLNAVGIRVKMRTMERAAFLSAWREKKLRGVFMTAVGASGNAATRAEAFMYSKGTYAYGGILTSTSCSSSRRASATAPSARPSCTRSNGSPSSGRCSPRSWTCAGSRAWGHAWLSIPSTRFPCTPAQRWRTCDLKSRNSDVPVMATLRLGGAVRLAT